MRAWLCLLLLYFNPVFGQSSFIDVYNQSKTFGQENQGKINNNTTISVDNQVVPGYGGTNFSESSLTGAQLPGEATRRMIAPTNEGDRVGKFLYDNAGTRPRIELNKNDGIFSYGMNAVNYAKNIAGLTANGQYKDCSLPPPPTTTTEHKLTNYYCEEGLNLTTPTCSSTLDVQTANYNVYSCDKETTTYQKTCTKTLNASCGQYGISNVSNPYGTVTYNNSVAVATGGYATYYQEPDGWGEWYLPVYFTYKITYYENGLYKEKTYRTPNNYSQYSITLYNREYYYGVKWGCEVNRIITYCSPLSVITKSYQSCYRGSCETLYDGYYDRPTTYYPYSTEWVNWIKTQYPASYTFTLPNICSQYNTSWTEVCQ